MGSSEQEGNREVAVSVAAQTELFPRWPDHEMGVIRDGIIFALFLNGWVFYSDLMSNYDDNVMDLEEQGFILLMLFWYNRCIKTAI